jgi:DNA-binding transcriptional MerR regulator
LERKTSSGPLQDFYTPWSSASIRAVSEPGDGERGVYSIGAVARMLGLSVATIRNWESRYGTIVAERSPGGHRLYSRDQVERLRFIADEVARGLSAADAHRVLAEHGSAGGPRSPDGSGARQRPLVLIAERDPLAAELEASALRAEGYDVDLSLTVRDAEATWLERRPGLAIVELMISGGLGLELCRRLKGDDATRVLAVSVLEAQGDALAAGADAFLRKPADPLELVSTVGSLLGAGAPVAAGGRGAPS